MITDKDLPPLPEMSFLGDPSCYGYSDESIRAYARQAVAEALAGREGAAIRGKYRLTAVGPRPDCCSPGNSGPEGCCVGNCHFDAETRRSEQEFDKANPAAQPAPAEVMKLADQYAAATGEIYSQAAQDPAKVARMAERERAALQAHLAAPSAPAPAQGEREAARYKALDDRLQQWQARAALAAQPAAAPEPVAATLEWSKAVQEAYGWLWNVNVEPMAPIPLLSPEAAAYEARKCLRELLTTDQRGEGINAVRGLIARKLAAAAAAATGASRTKEEGGPNKRR